MRSLSKLDKRHPEKKKSGQAVTKESRKSSVSLAAKKKPVIKKVAGKGTTLPRKKEAPKATAKPARKPVPPAPPKKQPVKARPAPKAAQPVKKKEAPKTAAKPARKPVPPAAPEKQRVKKQEAPAVKEKASQAKVISPETIQPSVGNKVVVFEEVQTRNVMVSPGDLGKRYKCYKCGVKFYDLGRPQPLCPSCGANQLDGVVKAARRRRGKHRSAVMAKTEPLPITPGEHEDLHEVVEELDAEYVLDVDDIVLEEHQDSEDKE